MQKKLPYILAILLPFLVVWPLSVILLPQAQTKLHLWVIGIALFIVIFFAVWRGKRPATCWPWMGCSTWTKVSQEPCCFSTHS